MDICNKQGSETNRRISVTRVSDFEISEKTSQLLTQSRHIDHGLFMFPLQNKYETRKEVLLNN